LKSQLGVFVGIYVLTVVGLAVFQRRFMYFPDRRLTHPAEAGMSGVEELSLATDDGETLVAWHVPPREGYPLILYFHGNGGSLSDRIPRFRLFVASGYGFLAVSYRGYGGSSGSPTETGLMRDGETAYRETHKRGYPTDRIVLMGESLGTAVATVLAGAHNVAALVLDSPYSSAVEVAATHYWMFPVRWLLLDRYRTDLAIRNVHTPILVVHGDQDSIVPIKLAQRLFDFANEPKTFMAVPGAGHLVLGAPGVFPRVREWIDMRTSVKRR
jgi:fermentation-respiration switch protein FrsA (DUF1100 family)